MTTTPGRITGRWTRPLLSRRNSLSSRWAPASVLSGTRLRMSTAPSASGWNAFKAAHLHRSEEHTSELQSQSNLVCRLLLEKKKKIVSDHVDRSGCQTW